MMLDFDHDEVNWKDDPEESSLVEEATNHVELTIRDEVLPKVVHDNEGMETKGNLPQFEEREVYFTGHRE
ncbi:unnamed protein product [Linum trigynum]|uniref:Uncharacterized protein n=1 Tax=Linum trigynum TaxID=586398 RepID=A0AAV2E186_9ROSI